MEDTTLEFKSIPKAKWAERLIVVGFWVLLFALSIVQRATSPRGPEGLTTPEIFYTGIEYFSWLLITPVVFWLVRRYSFDRGDWPRKVLLHVGFALFFATVMQVITREAFYTFIHTGERFGSLGESLIGLRFLDELFVYLFILFAGFARDYFYRYRDRLQETVTLKTQSAELHAQLAEAKLRALQMQLNPHFLFNTLNAISTLIDRNPGKAKSMISMLSDLLRYTLDSGETQTVTIENELQFLRKYLAIQEVRFGDRLKIVEKVEEEVMPAMVPSFILQPIVENSIKHGVTQIVDEGKITIEVSKTARYLNILISDNGPGLTTNGDNGDSSTKGGLGLKNTRERLKGLYGDDHKFEIRNGTDGGAEVNIRLPFESSTELRVEEIGSVGNS